VNTTILRALFEDARQQVLDNKVFRLLVILTLFPILLTFVIGFREEGIVILWGLESLTYQQLLEAFPSPGQIDVPDISAQLIQGLQSIVTDVLVGNVGMMLCIAATAFFAPRILEKGAADTLFSKPVSRATILLSRYFAGILFVTFIAIVLVVGMYLGFWIVSGYQDAGFLWGAVTLVYVYAIMHAFSIAVAVFTRSSTAAILMTLFLFIVCGGLHYAWRGYSYNKEQAVVAKLRAGAELEESQEEDSFWLLDAVKYTFEALHYTLPKTGDADLITGKLRRALTESPAVIETEDSDFVVKKGPAGFELLEGTAKKLDQSGVEWTSSAEGGAQAGRVVVRRYLAPEVERTVGGKVRRRRLSSKEAADQFIVELESTGVEPELSSTRLSDVRVMEVGWTTEAGAEKHSRLLLQFDEWMYAVDITLAAGLMDEFEQQHWRSGFLQNGNIVLGQIAGMGPGTWYAKVFTWDAELKYNVFFSIGSSLAFVLAMLSLACLKLRKIDF
jgi:ABC-type transport system involved in multi-copper enzyme maturation permease subunit